MEVEGGKCKCLRDLLKYHLLALVKTFQNSFQSSLEPRFHPKNQSLLQMIFKGVSQFKSNIWRLYYCLYNSQKVETTQIFIS